METVELRRMSGRIAMTAVLTAGSVSATAGIAAADDSGAKPTVKAKSLSKVRTPAQAADSTYRIWSRPDPVMVWVGGCLYSENGAYNTLGIDQGTSPATPCDDIRSMWVFEKVDTTAGGTTLYNIRHANDDKCVGVQGVEGGDTHIGQVLQLEGCENGDDGRWYLRDHPSHWPHGQRGGVYLHNYSPNHRDLAMQPGQFTGARKVQLQEYPEVRGTSWKRTGL